MCDNQRSTESLHVTQGTDNPQQTQKTQPRVDPKPPRLRPRTIFDSILHFGSAEFLLTNRPTGGGVVFARAAWTAVLVYAAAIALKEVLPPDSTLRFSSVRLRFAIVETLSWAGAIFAGTYAAFYTRFQAQYAYLADLYNQIMAAQVQAPPNDQNEEAYAAWWAGFIEDAEELHLETKPVFASVIASVLNRPGVRAKYANHTPGGEARLKHVEQRIAAVLAEEAQRQMKRIASR